LTDNNFLTMSFVLHFPPMALLFSYDVSNEFGQGSPVLFFS
jgi:hypothetical protein